MKPRIEITGLIIGKDIFLVYSPEREDPGTKDFTTHTISFGAVGEAGFFIEEMTYKDTAGKLLAEAECYA